MFENITNFLKKLGKKQKEKESSDTAKERLHLVLMQDRANVSADFLDLMKEEIIEVIKKYIDIDETAMDVRLTNQTNEDGTQGAPALYANIPIINIKDENKKINNKEEVKEEKIEQTAEEKDKEIKEENEEDKPNEEASEKDNTMEKNEEENKKVEDDKSSTVKEQEETEKKEEKVNKKEESKDDSNKNLKKESENE